MLPLWSPAEIVLSLAGMQQASINLTQSLHEVYEPDWHGKDDVLTIGKVRVIKTSQSTQEHQNPPEICTINLGVYFLQDCDALWEDFHNKLVDSTLLNLDAYLQQFPDLKAINSLVREWFSEMDACHESSTSFCFRPVSPKEAANSLTMTVPDTTWKPCRRLGWRMTARWSKWVISCVDGHSQDKGSAVSCYLCSCCICAGVL